MKKTVKSLIIAASVAAIAGIGAVSFAAWSTSSVPVAVPGAAGTVVTRGITLKTNSLAVTEDVDDDTEYVLVPFDQDILNSPLTTAGKTASKLWTIELQPTEGIGSNYTVTVTKGSSNNLPDGAKLYVNNSSTIDASKAINATENAAWQEIDADGVSLAPTSNIIYIVLDASNNYGMGATIDVVVTLDTITSNP